MSKSDPNDPPDREKRFEIDYKRHDDDIRHYSTTRSALTSFLMTIGLGLLAYHFSNSYPERPRFLWITGFTLLAAALCGCFVFSWRTERSALFRKDLWHWATGEIPDYPVWSDYKQKWSEIFRRMRKDSMNSALLIVVAVIAISFWILKHEVKAVQRGYGNGQHGTDKKCQCLNHAGSTNAAQAYALAAKSAADAAKAYADATRIAADAAKTCAESAKAGGAACACTITVNCGESCPKTHSRGKHRD